jgi:predicted enzyme related to lactoylglutathione lyase
MTLTSFEIVSIPVSDPHASKAFYQHTLGFDLIRESPMGPGMTWIQLAPKGCAVTIALVTWFDTMKPGGVQGLMFNTDDLDADHAALSAKGVVMSAIGSEPWGRYATLKDPDGNGLILRQAHAA